MTGNPVVAHQPQIPLFIFSDLLEIFRGIIAVGKGQWVKCICLIVVVTGVGVSADPYPTGRIFEKTDDPIVRQAFRIVRIVTVNPELMSVETVQSVVCPEPHESFFIL